MTSEELAAIRARVEAATPGPWVSYTNAPHEAAEARPPSGCSVDSRAAENVLLWAGRHRDREGGFYDDSVVDDVVMRADATFIAHARQDVPRLCDEVARLTSEVERLSARVPRWVNVGTDRAVWRLRVAGQDVGSTQIELDTSGRWYEWPACVRYPDLPTACAAVCRRLGLPDILPPENP